jgi:hypothetical protein
MAGKELASPNSGSTFKLDGEPSPANGEGDSFAQYLEEALADDVMPLAMVTPEGKWLEVSSSSASHTSRSRSRSTSRSPYNSLSPVRTHSTKARGTSPLRRPTTGVLSPAKTRPRDSTGAFLKPGEKHVGTVVTKSGDVAAYQYSSPGHSSDDSPPRPRFRIEGQRRPGGGYGKVLIPISSSEPVESTDSCSTGIRRRLPPPPIQGPGGQFEDDLPIEPTVPQLVARIKTLRIQNRDQAAEVQELKLKHQELEGEVDIIRHRTNVNLRRLFKELGKEKFFMAV